MARFSDLCYRLLVELQGVGLPVDVLVGPPEPDVVEGDDAVPFGREHRDLDLYSRDVVAKILNLGLNTG